MITLDKTPEFYDAPKVVGCFIEYDGKILMLLRNFNKIQGGTWGAPGGKVDDVDYDDTLLAIIREVKEETGIPLDAENLKQVGVFYVIHPQNNKFIYVKYHAVLKYKPDVLLKSDEHENFLWVTPEESLKLNLILDEDYTIKHVYGIQ